MKIDTILLRLARDDFRLLNRSILARLWTDAVDLRARRNMLLGWHFAVGEFWGESGWVFGYPLEPGDRVYLKTAGVAYRAVHPLGRNSVCSMGVMRMHRRHYHRLGTTATLADLRALLDTAETVQSERPSHPVRSLVEQGLWDMLGREDFV